MAVLFVQDIGQIGVQHRLKTQGAQVTLQDPLEQNWKLTTKQDLTEYYWISGIQKVSMSNFGDVTPLWTTSISWFKKNGTTIADQLKANVGWCYSIGTLSLFHQEAHLLSRGKSSQPSFLQPAMFGHAGRKQSTGPRRKSQCSAAENSLHASMMALWVAIVENFSFPNRTCYHVFFFYR